MATGHKPVLLEESVSALQVGGDAVVVDATFGGGGHTRRVLAELGEGGAVIGVDRDPEAAARAEDLRSDGRFAFVAGPFDEVLWGMVERESGRTPCSSTSASRATRSTTPPAGSPTWPEDRST